MNKEIKEKLQESHWILDILMEYVPEGISIAIAISVTDIPDIIIHKISKYGAQLFGYSREILEGIPFKDIIKKLNICRIMKVKDIIKTLEKDGWYLARTKGSHRQFKHPVKPGIVTVAGNSNHDLPPGTLNSILKQAGLK